MKKFSVVLLVSMLLMMTASFVFSAALKVGLSLPTQREERWVRDFNQMMSDAKKANVTLLSQISDLDTAKQISQCENLISEGVKVLIVAPNDATSAAVIVEKAHAANIKVISYDRLILNADTDLYLSFDNFGVGVLQGTWLVKAAPKGNYVVMSGDPGDNNAKLFHDGAMSVIKPLVDKGDIKIVMDQPCQQWLAANAQKNMENALTANNNNIQGVLAPNDNTANGCIQALAAQGLAGKVPITGQDAQADAAIRIVKGTQGMTIFKDTRKLASAAIQDAIDIANGKDPKDIAGGKTINNGKIDVPFQALTPYAVDKSNLDELLINSGYLKKSDVYK